MRNVVPIPTPAEGNNLYPLPPNYYEEDAEYQRVARINAVRQYLIPTKDPKLRALRAVESLRFFDLYYLWPDEEADFNPMFYDDMPRFTPDFHWQIRALEANHRFCMAIAPRGGAKTTYRKKDVAHRLVTRPQMSFVYATSTHDNAKTVGTQLKDVLYNNERLIDDFSPEEEFGGRFKPGRGELPTGNEYFYLTNRSWLQLSSAESRQRGKRPRGYILDDPEYDASGSTDVALLREGLETLLFKLIMPMMFRPNVFCSWIGTYVSKQHLLFRASQPQVGEESVDKRFDHWARIMVPVTYEDDTGSVHSCWPDLWPLTIADKKALAEEHQDDTYNQLFSVEEMEDHMGPEIFAAEMEGKPGDAKGSGFASINEEEHGYHWENVDDTLAVSPFLSDATLVFHRAGVTQRLSAQELRRNAVFVLPIDTAYTNGPMSDWKVGTVVALIPSTNELFIFDMHHTKEDQTILVEDMLDMAIRWNATMWPEVTRKGEDLFQTLRQQAAARLVAEPDAKVPSVQRFKPGPMEKTRKIEALKYRFDHGLIKLPFYLRKRDPWRHLFHQIEGFNPRVQDGGLANDDHIDTVAMANMIVRARRGSLEYDQNINPHRSSIEAIEAGELDMEPGMPRVVGCFNQLTVPQIAGILENRRDSSGPQQDESVV